MYARSEDVNGPSLDVGRRCKCSCFDHTQLYAHAHCARFVYIPWLGVELSRFTLASYKCVFMADLGGSAGRRAQMRA